MATQPDPIEVSPQMLRRLARDNQEIGKKLAQHEYELVIAELANPKVFNLEIDFPNAPAPEIRAPLLFDEADVAHLPRVNVTLGTVAWDVSPAKLPVVGIYCPALDHDTLREAVSALITAHFTKPFARFVFLCDDIRLVPLLGRYQFTYEHIGAHDVMALAMRLRRRFGMQEIRDLVTGNRLWAAPSDEPK